MIIVLQIILGIVGLFLAVFLEVLFLTLLNFRMMLLFFFLARKRVDWKLLLVVTTIMSLILDVVLHYRLGTNLLLFTVSTGILFLLSFIFSVDEDGIPMYVSTFIASLGFYLVNQLLPSLFTTGTAGFLDAKIFFVLVLKAIVTTGLVWLGEVLVSRFRDRGNSKQIRLK